MAETAEEKYLIAAAKALPNAARRAYQTASKRRL